ncbi:MAG TPA: Ni/Fe hydrogenase subunit alpha [Anaerolineae bacterium]|jgi:F420-non-reducing hydrogenase large subunit|nr:Ni/Fe hydrogenase subunit alpha [Anaerolineae bacterium]
MTTLTFPLSRIEGHARVVIEIHDGEVNMAHFQAMELRGFEYLVQGTPAEQMPVIVPRICGVCSTAHHVAAVKALEDAYDVTPPLLALKIRELLLLGQLIQNQATSVFVFTMPDRLGLTSIFEHAKDSQSEKVRLKIAGRALQVRKAGTDLISLAGGQFIHPVKAVIGGVTSGIDSEAAGVMRAQLEEALPLACELFDGYWESSLAMRERVGTWGDDAPAHYIAAVDECRPNYDGDLIRVMSPEGKILDRFPARTFRDYLTLEDTDYSYADCTSYKGEVMRANSLARINMAEQLGTPRADQYLARFRDAFGRPAHAILLFDLARGIELVYGLEQAIEILSEPLDDQDADVPYTPRDGDGYGLVEAPRGPLIHHYHIEKGLIAQAQFIIPTMHNVLAIEQALRVAAERYIDAERVDMELELAVGRVVRAFDPCIACATH